MEGGGGWRREEGGGSYADSGPINPCSMMSTLRMTYGAQRRPVKTATRKHVARPP